MEIQVEVNGYPREGDFVVIQGKSAKEIVEALRELQREGIIELPNKEG